MALQHQRIVFVGPVADVFVDAREAVREGCGSGFLAGESVPLLADFVPAFAFLEVLVLARYMWRYNVCGWVML